MYGDVHTLSDTSLDGLEVGGRERLKALLDWKTGKCMQGPPADPIGGDTGRSGSNNGAGLILTIILYSLLLQPRRKYHKQIAFSRATATINM